MTMEEALVLGQLVTAAGVVLVAIITAVGTWLSAKANDQARKTHTAVNGRMEELLRMARNGAFREGVVRGVQDQRDQNQRDAGSAS
jgi:hypothetical protein